MIGIYKISSIVHPDRIYVGSAVDILSRWYIHKSDFKLSRRHSPHFQRHYDKYGKDDLVFSIIATCAKEDLILVEQAFIDSYKPYFNGCKTAGNTLGFKHSIESKEKRRKWCIEHNHRPPSTKGMKHSAECGKKHSANNIRLGLVPPSRLGTHKSDESKHKQSQSMICVLLEKELNNYINKYVA